MRRRAISILTIAVVIAIATVGPAQVVLDTLVPLPAPAFTIKSMRSDLNRAARPYSGEYSGPLIDAHIHINLSQGDVGVAADPKKIIKALDAAGVKLAVVMPTPNEGRKSMGMDLLHRNFERRVRHRAAVVKVAPGRIVRFCCGNYVSYWLHVAYHEGYRQKELDAFLDRLSQDLNGGAYAGVGEIAIYHFNKNGENPVIDYPPNFIPFLRVAELIADKGLWLNLHAEPMDPNNISYERQAFAAIDLVMRRAPVLKLILAHSAMTNPANLRNILRRYPTVMVDIKHRNKHRTWFNLEPINNLNRELYEDWAILFEEQPERFIVGEDLKFYRRGFDRVDYVKNITRMRLMLGSISRRAADLIAFDNARRMYAKGWRGVFPSGALRGGPR